MTGEELRHIRESKGLTRAEFARVIGNCSASGIVKWESGNPAVPQWVADKLLSSVKLELPLTDLAALVNHATAHGLKFEDLLSTALQDYLTTHKAKILPMPKPHAVAEDMSKVGEDTTAYNPKRKAANA